MAKGYGDLTENRLNLQDSRRHSLSQTILVHIYGEIRRADEARGVEVDSVEFWILH